MTKPPLARYSPHAAAYTAAWRMIIKLATNEPTARVRMGEYTTMTAREARADFLQALHKRISARDPKPYTAKQSQDYEASARRDKHRIHERINHRVRVYQFETSEARRRFSHLLSSYQD